MSLRPARSIRAKLALLVAVSVGAAVLLAFAVSSYRELSRFGEAKRAEVEATAAVLAASVADAVARRDRPAAVRALNAIGRMPAVEFAEIRLADGSAFAEAGAGVALAPRAGANRTAPASLLSMLTRGSFFVTAAIVKGGVELGTLALLVDTSELAARLRQALWAAAISAAAAVAIGLLIAARLQRSITRPLGELAATMNRVRLTSDFAARAERRSEDETGQLVDAFNDMLDQIGERDRALEDHREGLERTVDERTRQLADARDVAESANRAKSDFLATMSHEIRTPMNGMLVMAELLAGTDLPARQQRYAETIARSGQTLLAIINDILDISKIEAGKLELEQGRVPIATIVEDVLGLFFERASAKGLDLAAAIAADVPEAIEGDPVRLSQILSNLVNNALKFTERGHVLVEVTRDSGAGAGETALVFSVTDTGIGISADKLERVFEAFSQADQSTTRRFGGTGLGLSICRRLVKAMGGRLWVESEAGKGSRFAFSIVAPVLDASTPTRTVEGRFAVVAVDAPATRRVLADALAAAGYGLRSDDSSTDGGADIVFADIRAIAARGAAVERPSGCDIVCVAGVGEARVDELLAAGTIDGVLMHPVASSRVRELLATIESGGLATLNDARHAAAPALLPSFEGLRVLVADDSAVNREVVSEALSRLKARTRMVDDGRQAVAAFAEGKFHVVLMDCSMPEMDGFAATREIRDIEAVRGLARTPVVALTAHLAGSVAESWRDAGMDDYLTKPFTMRSLATCLARWRPEGGALGEEPTRSEETAEAPSASTSAGSPASESDPLDPGVLKSLRAIAGGNDAMLDRIFGLFQSHAPARLAALQEAVSQSDATRVAAEAHALKSPSLNIGALRLGALCGALESRARSGGEPITAADLGHLEDEFGAVIAAIERSRAPHLRAAS